MAISSLLPIISFIAMSEPDTLYDPVFAAMDKYILATEEKPRRLLATVLMGMVRTNIVQGRDSTAVRQLTQIHDQVMDLDGELQELLPILAGDVEIEVYPEQGCLLMIGVQTVYTCSRDWSNLAASLKADHLSAKEMVQLDGMAADLKSLIAPYRELMATLDTIDQD